MLLLKQKADALIQFDHRFVEFPVKKMLYESQTC